MAFANTGGLFIGALADVDKKFLKEVLKNARGRGYQRFVEPCAGGLALSFLAAECGFEPSKIEASDITFFSGVLGRAVEGRSLEDMEIEAEGFTEAELQDPATALYAQLYLRTLNNSGKEYFLEILKDLQYRRTEHIENIRRQIEFIKQKCGGLKYRDMDLMDHLQEIMDDETAVVALWAPTYKAGYEKFFDTNGKLKWKEPSYGVFDPETGVQTLYDMVKDAKALVLISQERTVGECIGEPVFGRDSGRNSVYRYMTANRVEEFKELADGKAILRNRGAKMSPLKYPIIPYEHEITKDSKIDVIPIKAENATYYRRLWTHNFVGGASGCCMAVIADGYVAGVFGYDKFMVSLSGGEDLLIKFCIAAPNVGRINRLSYMLAVNKEIVYPFLSDIEKSTIKGLSTTMLTKYKVNMEIRGIMKLVSRKKDPQNGYKLQYRCDMKERTKEETLREWLRKEEHWKSAREN